MGTGNTGPGTDLLIYMSTAPLVTGFPRPLAAGEYTFLLQDTEATFGYSLKFQLSSAVAGDFTGNSVVDGGDLTHWAAHFGVDGQSDADDDGDSDGADFLAWERNFGHGLPAAAVPEPTAWALLAALPWLLRRGSRVSTFRIFPR
jgi:hypothetical protein